MKKKVALSIYLEPELAQALREVSDCTHIPQQYFMREGLKSILEHYQLMLAEPSAPPNGLAQ